MGAWGHGIFEDDAALDFMEEIEASEDPKALFKTAFELAMELDELEYDQAIEVIVSAAYIDAVLNGTKYTRDDTPALPIDAFAEKYPSLGLATLKDNARTALQMVTADHSELNELWSENQEEHPLWKNEIERLTARLA